MTRAMIHPFYRCFQSQMFSIKHITIYDNMKGHACTDKHAAICVACFMLTEYCSGKKFCVKNRYDRVMKHSFRNGMFRQN